jgi:thiol-disulfide isomerase/thioredoxin
MARDTDLDPLRERPDFQALVAELDRRNPGKPLTPARLVAAYKEQYQLELANYQSSRRRAETAAERRLVERSKPKPADFAPRFLKFAADHAADAAAVEGLAWVLENVPAGGRGAELRGQALFALEREHMNKSNLAAVCERLAQSPSQECDKLLRAVVEKHVSPDVRGAAALALADSLGQQAQTLYATDRAASASLFAEAERLYEAIQRESAGVAYSQGTLGETAQAKLYKLRHLSVGRPAQEINGPDLDGRPMKLSDFRGKVVVVDFWANWCGFCRKMYPHEKAMIKRLAGEPFALVGVNCDEDAAEVRREVSRHGINWRSWWDRGAGGRQVSEAWQVDAFPRVFVLDHTGVIRHSFDGLVRPDVLDAAVADLLAEAKAARAGR